MTWLLQLLVGVGLFVLSFLIENQVFQAFMNAPIIALFLALALELGKAVAIIWHRYLGLQQDYAYPLITRSISVVFRFGLLLLSVLCSLLYLSQQLDRPYLKEIRAQALQQIETETSNERQRLQTNNATHFASLLSRQRVEVTEMKAIQQSRITQLEKWLHNEMNNVVNGFFQGPRYQAFEQQLFTQQAKNQQHLNTLAKRHESERSSLQASQDHNLLKLKQLAEQQRQAVLDNDYATDERVNNNLIVAFLQVSETVFNLTVHPMQFVFLFSILLSLLMELGIILAFDTITVAVIPALKAQHKAEVSKESLHAELDGLSDCDDINHQAAINRIKKAGNRVKDKARQYSDSNSLDEEPPVHLV